MKKLTLLFSLLGLVLVIGSAILYLSDLIEKDSMKSLMLIGTIIWFVLAPFWMKEEAKMTPK